MNLVKLRGCDFILFNYVYSYFNNHYIFKNTLGSNNLCLLCLNIIIITFFSHKVPLEQVFSKNNYKKI